MALARSSKLGLWRTTGAYTRLPSPRDKRLPVRRLHRGSQHHSRRKVGLHKRRHGHAWRRVNASSGECKTRMWTVSWVDWSWRSTGRIYEETLLHRHLQRRRVEWGCSMESLLNGRRKARRVEVLHWLLGVKRRYGQPRGLVAMLGGHRNTRPVMIVNTRMTKIEERELT